MPGGQEPGQRLGLDGLDLAAQQGQRPLAQRAQHVWVAPLPLRAVRPELAPQQQAGVGPPGQQVVDHGHGQTEALGGLDACERRVGTGPPAQQRAQRVVGGIEEGLR